ncbi:unnamed protein product [Closterium sp. NIES-54]
MRCVVQPAAARRVIPAISAYPFLNHTSSLAHILNPLSHCTFPPNFLTYVDTPHPHPSSSLHTALALFLSAASPLFFPFSSATAASDFLHSTPPPSHVPGDRGIGVHEGVCQCHSPALAASAVPVRPVSRHPHPHCPLRLPTRGTTRALIVAWWHGGMVAWWHGGMVAWWHGGMVAWWHGGMPQVVFVVLKFMAVWVDSQILFLTPDDTAQLFHLCLQLLEAYAAHNMGKVSLQRSRQLSEGVRESKYKDLKALLQLLSSLTSKDLLDFGASLPGQSADVAQMVCLGVNIIIPLISLDLLQFPKLCLQYFTLLEHMCCVHPEKVLALPDSAFHPIMHTLEFGLQHQDEEILVLSLSSVSSLASPTSSSSSSSASLAPEHVQRHQALVAHLLRLVLQLVLLQPLRNETVEAAADALLPLILACPQLTQTILSEAVSSHVDPAGQLHLSSAVSTFLAAASAAAAASASATSAAAARPVRRRFRSALAAFIADVQGLIVRRCAAMVSTLLNSQTPPFLSSPPLCSNAVVVATRETTAAAAAADDERLGARAAAGRCLGQRLGAAATEQHGAARRRGAAGRAGECHSGRRRSVVRAMGCLQGSRELS